MILLLKGLIGLIGLFALICLLGLLKKISLKIWFDGYTCGYGLDK